MFDTSAPLAASKRSSGPKIFTLNVRDLPPEPVIPRLSALSPPSPCAPSGVSGSPRRGGGALLPLWRGWDEEEPEAASEFRGSAPRRRHLHALRAPLAQRRVGAAWTGEVVQLSRESITYVYQISEFREGSSSACPNDLAPASTLSEANNSVQEPER